MLYTYNISKKHVLFQHSSLRHGYKKTIAPKNEGIKLQKRMQEYLKDTAQTNFLFKWQIALPCFNCTDNFISNCVFSETFFSHISHLVLSKNRGYNLIPRNYTNIFFGACVQ